MTITVRAWAFPDVLIITPRRYHDHRGWFQESYNLIHYQSAGITRPFVQDNQSFSHQWTLRGLHYQLRYPQGKLVSVPVGRIFDVIVDIRRSSPTFGRWAGRVLDDEGGDQLWVPPGYAHGFLVLSETALVAYKVTAYFAPAWSRTIMWNDPDIAIDWPLPKGQQPIVSATDAAGDRLAHATVYQA